jgi:hypothetical protein
MNDSRKYVHVYCGQGTESSHALFPELTKRSQIPFHIHINVKMVDKRKGGNKTTPGVA